MKEFRIVMSEHDETLEKKIKQKLEPYCSSIYIVEEDGDAGLTVSIIALVLALPGFVVNIKEIVGWFNDKKAKTRLGPGVTQCTARVSEKISDETPFEWAIETCGHRFNLEAVDSKEQQDLLVDKIIEEFKDNG